jgi:hypothetical protein
VRIRGVEGLQQKRKRVGIHMKNLVGTPTQINPANTRTRQSKVQGTQASDRRVSASAVGELSSVASVRGWKLEGLDLVERNAVQGVS